MTGKLSKNFHGVGIGPLSKILAVKYGHTFFIKCGSSHTESISSLDSFGATSKVRVVGATKMSECVTTEQSGTGMGLVPREATIITGPETQFFLLKREILL